LQRLADHVVPRAAAALLQVEAEFADHRPVTGTAARGAP
jgi:hypothetical protein